MVNLVAGRVDHFTLKTLQTWLRLCRVMYDIVGMVGDQYIVKTDKGLNFSLYLIVILKDLTPFFFMRLECQGEGFTYMPNI